MHDLDEFDFDLELPPILAPSKPECRSVFVTPSWWKPEYDDILLCEYMTKEELDAALVRMKNREKRREKDRAYRAKNGDKLRAAARTASYARQFARVAAMEARIEGLKRQLEEQRQARNLLAAYTENDLIRARWDLANYIDRFALHLKPTDTTERNTDG